MSSTATFSPTFQGLDVQMKINGRLVVALVSKEMLEEIAGVRELARSRWLWTHRTRRNTIERMIREQFAQTHSVRIVLHPGFEARAELLGNCTGTPAEAGMPVARPDAATQESEMADDPKVAHGQDRERINVNQDYELRDWSKKLGVTPERLKEAVQAVGDRADKVQEHLKGSSERKPAKRSGER